MIYEITVELPEGTERIEAGLYYQTTSREFIEFLRDEINGDATSLGVTNKWGEPSYRVQTDPWFHDPDHPSLPHSLAGWGDTIWKLWDQNKDVPGAAPVLMTNTVVALDVTDHDGDGIPAYWEELYFVRCHQRDCRRGF